jgi:hypothetical protein
MEPRKGQHHLIRRIRAQDGSLTTRIGEMPMQRRYSAHHHPQSKMHQLDLFAQPVVASAMPVPDLRTLPATTRQALTTLIARLILEHMHGDCQADREEVRRDD